jgi:hypothetical protein
MLTIWNNNFSLEEFKLYAEIKLYDNDNTTVTLRKQYKSFWQYQKYGKINIYISTIKNKSCLLFLLKEKIR